MSQTVQRQTNQMPAWLMSSGAVVGVVGAIVKKHAEKIGELMGRLRSERPLRSARRALTGRAVLSWRWERATEWPLMIAAVLFLVAYAVPVLGPDLPSWLLGLCRWLSWITWGILLSTLLSGCSWPTSGGATWSGTGTTSSCSPYRCSGRFGYSA